jgi:hypothetical protein
LPSRALLLCLAFGAQSCAHGGDENLAAYEELRFDRAGHTIIWDGRRSVYQDCSSANYFCLLSESFDIVILTTCSPSVLQTGWTYAGVEMRLVAEAHNGDDPHIGVGFSTYLYRPSTKPDSLIMMIYNPHAGENARGYVIQLGRTGLGTPATPDDIGEHPSAWHRFSGGVPLGECRG